MIYIENESQITIPRHTFTSYASYILTLASNMSNPTIIVNGLGNISTNTYYYQFLVTIPNTLPAGEYKYTLTNSDGLVLENGLVTYGNYNRVGLASNNTSTQKIQYNGNTSTML